MKNKKLIKILGITTLILIPNEIQNREFKYFKIDYKPKIEIQIPIQKKQNYEEEISELNHNLNKTNRKINFLNERLNDSTYSSEIKENYSRKIRNYQNEMKMLKQKKDSLENL